jgi:hypothetical protein
MHTFKLILGFILVFAASGSAFALDAVDVMSKQRDTYYRVQQDFRKCASPLCGGFFITALNRGVMTCSDGSKSESCYVAKIDWHDTGLDPDQIREMEAATANGRVIVLGRTAPFRYPYITPDRTAPLRDSFFDGMWLLDAALVWEAASDNEPDGTFVRVEDSGIRCITEPCFSLRATLLNRYRARTVRLSGLDLSGAGARPEQLEAARHALSDGMLLVAGKMSRKASWTTNGRTLTALQFYLPVEPMECKVDADCTLSAYLAPVAGPDECYCTTCNGAPISVTEAMSNEKQWIDNCQYKSTELICPLYPCVFPGPVGCVKNTCEYLQ